MQTCNVLFFIQTINFQHSKTGTCHVLRIELELIICIQVRHVEFLTPKERGPFFT
jgi:hypothetical protein